MATPWTTSAKDIDLSNDSRHYNRYVPVSAGFTAPLLVSSLTCGPQALFAAMAKAQALRTANAAIVAALVRAATALVEAIVDDAGNRFDLTPETDMLENTVRHALSGSVGAGICHLYMVALGYVWQDFAANVISTTGKLADFAYDGGPASGHGIVLAEAKGSFSGKVDPSQVKKTADSAYQNQVDGHIAAWTSNRSAQIVHGYAIAFGAQPDAVRKTASPPHAMLHVAETDQPTAAFVASGAGADVAVANTALALGNYRAAFMLARAPLVVDVIDWLRTGRSPAQPSPEYQTFHVIAAGGREFWVGEPEGHPDGWAYRHLRPSGPRRFAVEATVARRFLSALSGMLQQGMAPGTIGSEAVKPLELPVLQPQLAGDNEALWFPDGLASIARTGVRGQLRWSPKRGLV